MTPDTYMLWAVRLYSVMHIQGVFEYTVGHGCKVMYAVPHTEDRTKYIVEAVSFEAACHSIGQEFMRDYKVLFVEYDQRIQNLQQAAATLSEKAGKIPDKELIDLYKKYWKAHMAFQPYMMFPHSSERELEPAVKAKYPEDFDVICGLEKPLEHMKMNRAILTRPMDEVVREYGYLSVYAQTEKPYTAEHFEKIKKELDPAKIEESFKELKRNADAYKALQAKIRPEDKVLCDILHQFIFVRTDRIDGWKKHSYLMYGFAEYLAHKIDARLTVREGSMLTKDEIIEILEGKSQLTYEEMMLRGRRDSVMIWLSKDGWHTTSDKTEIARVEALVKNEQKEADTIKGVPACKGLVSGRAIVFLKKEDIKDEDNDYILVCPHTSPQDVPYMKRAKAIVTDEGGITSHAAIVSRELNVPCVVGTKNGTRVIKTGDMVEVDANKGVVRKIG